MLVMNRVKEVPFETKGGAMEPKTYGWRTCKGCEQSFEARYRKQKFCLPSCRKQHYFQERQQKMALAGSPQCRRCRLYFSGHFYDYDVLRCPRWTLRMDDPAHRLYCKACRQVYQDALLPLVRAYRPCHRCQDAIVLAFRDKGSEPIQIVPPVLRGCRRDRQTFELLAKPVEIIARGREVYGSETERRLHMLVPVLDPNGAGGYGRWISLPNGHQKRPDFFVNHESKREWGVVEVFGEMWHGPRRALYYGDAAWREDTSPDLLIHLYAQVDIRCLVIWAREVWKTPVEVRERVLSFIATP